MLFDPIAMKPIVWRSARVLLLIVLSILAGGRSLLAQAASLATPPAPASAGVVLKVDGGLPSPLALNEDDLLKLPRTEAHAADRDGRDATYSGVTLVDILRAAGLKFDPATKPAPGAVTSYVLVVAADRYSAIFALAEIDPTLSAHLVLLADRKNGQPLAPTEGPLRIIVPGDKRPARWVRQVTAISVQPIEPGRK